MRLHGLLVAHFGDPGAGRLRMGQGSTGHEKDERGQRMEVSFFLFIAILLLEYGSCSTSTVQERPHYPLVQSPSRDVGNSPWAMPPSYIVAGAEGFVTARPVTHFRLRDLFSNLWRRVRRAPRRIFVDCGSDTCKVLGERIERGLESEFFAFEPQPELAGFVEEARRRHPGVAIRFLAQAVWVYDGTMDFYSPPHGDRTAREARRCWRTIPAMLPRSITPAPSPSSASISAAGFGEVQPARPPGREDGYRGGGACHP